MGRAKIISTDINTMNTIVTSCSVKFNFEINEDICLGEFIRMERKGKEVILHFTKKTPIVVGIVDKPIIVSFD